MRFFTRAWGSLVLESEEDVLVMIHVVAMGEKGEDFERGKKL